MTELAIFGLAVAVIPTLASLATLHQGRRILVTADEIHTLTNSNLSKVLADLALANDRIAKLEGLVAKFAERNESEQDEQEQEQKEAKP
jgi:hypothetical protein